MITKKQLKEGLEFAKKYMTKPSWEERFEELIPKDTDILWGDGNTKPLCSRQAIINLFRTELAVQKVISYQQGYSKGRDELFSITTSTATTGPDVEKYY